MIKKILLALLLLAAPAYSRPEPTYQMELASSAPRIYILHNFLTPAECDHLIKAAKPHLQRSLVIDNATTQNKLDPSRSSHGMFFPYRAYDTQIHQIEKRIAHLTQYPIEHGEALQVLRYTQGAEYRPHHDYFDPTTIGGTAALSRGGQRVASLVMYLNTPPAGGETIFPHIKLSITPKKGDAVLFYNCHPNGPVDPLTLHGGAPVLEGEKWIATKWIRERVFN